VTTVFDVPELLKVMMQFFAATLQDVTCAFTCAELVNDPNRPNTKPATAIAAMSVMAMRMTVARTGEIAFLRLAALIFMADVPV